MSTGLIGMLYVCFALLLYALVHIINRNVLAARFSHISEAVISSILLYIIIVVLAKYADYSITQELNSFDLNGDGVVSANELSPEQEIAYDAVYKRSFNDTGRSIAPISGILFSVIYFFGLMLFFLIYDTVKGILFKK